MQGCHSCSAYSEHAYYMQRTCSRSGIAPVRELECRGPSPARVSSRELKPLLVHGHGHRVVFIFGKLRLQLRQHLLLFFPNVLLQQRAELAQFSCLVILTEVRSVDTKCASNVNMRLLPYH